VRWYGVNGSVTIYLGDGGGSGYSGSWLVTGGGLGLDMSLSCSSCAGSGLGLDMSLFCSSCTGSGVAVCWFLNMGGVGILGSGSAGVGGGSMTMVGGMIGDGGSAVKGSENLGGL